MSDQFLAEIRAFPFNFAPTGWATCDGQIMAISQNTALFSLLGTTYGGDGRVTFALPNLQGSVPVQPGQGQGLQQVFLGETFGESSVTLIQAEMPAHSHTMQAGTLPGNQTDPALHELTRASGAFLYDLPPATPSVAMATSMINVAGGGQPHNNMMPYLTLTYCIALQGIFPQRP